jgi:ribosomal protein L19E
VYEQNKSSVYIKYRRRRVYKTLLGKLKKNLTIAKRDYREAYDSGDTDKIIEAQARMNECSI